MRAEALSKMGKVAVVTGAAAGIGQAYAIRLAEDGADVVVIDRLGATDSRTSIEQRGRKATAYKGDLTDHAQVTVTTQSILREHGGCDILINNAGVGSALAFQDTSVISDCGPPSQLTWKQHFCCARRWFLRCGPKNGVESST